MKRLEIGFRPLAEADLFGLCFHRGETENHTIQAAKRTVAVVKPILEWRPAIDMRTKSLWHYITLNLVKSSISDPSDPA